MLQRAFRVGVQVGAAQPWNEISKIMMMKKKFKKNFEKKFQKNVSVCVKGVRMYACGGWGGGCPRAEIK